MLPVFDSIEDNSPQVADSAFTHRTRRALFDKSIRHMLKLIKLFFTGVYLLPCWNAVAQSSEKTSSDFIRYAMKLRTEALLKFDERAMVPPDRPVLPDSNTTGWSSASLLDRLASLHGAFSRYPWKLDIVTTIFWIGERASAKNPVPNNRSSWDQNWSANYGGYDDPNPGARRNFVPVSFVPRQNPFYVALPYNDIDGKHTKPEAKQVIPWFSTTFVRDGETVLKGRWLGVRHNNKVCYAQWEDCGPFCTDHWQYVFGNERPRPNLNQSAGLDVSPAVREYLGMNTKDVCDWKFVESREVPAGPWTMYGGNNTFATMQRQTKTQLAERTVLKNESTR
jgi:hypothetical protein